MIVCQFVVDSASACITSIFTSRVSGRGYRNGAVSVCLFVSALKAELFDIWSRNLVQGLKLIMSRTGLLVKVIGQRSRSCGQKNVIFRISDLSEQISSLGIWCDVMASWDHGVTSFDVTA